MRRAFAPLGLSGFRRLAGAYAINDIGDMVGAVALAILVYDKTGSAIATTALFVMAKFVPALVSPAIVAHLEPLPPARTLAILHLLQMVFYFVLAGLVQSFILSLILLIALVDGVLALTGRVLLRGSLAVQLEPKGLLREGNAIINMIFAVSTAAGPAFAGLIIAWQGVSAALVVDAISFGIIALVLFWTKTLRPAVLDYPSWYERFKRGFGWVSENYDLRLLLIGQALVLIFFASVVPIEVIYAKKTLDAGDAGFGALLSAWGVGIVVGSIVFAVLERIPILMLVAVSTIAIGVSYAGQAIAGTLLVACAFAALGGFGNGIQTVAVLTTIQARTPEALQTRVTGMFESLGAAMPGIGFLIGGVLTALFSPRVAFFVAALGVFLVVGIISLLFLRTRSSGGGDPGFRLEGEQSQPSASSPSSTSMKSASD